MAKDTVSIAFELCDCCWGALMLLCSCVGFMFWLNIGGAHAMVYFHECTVAGNAEGFECEHFMTEKTAQLYFGSAYVKPENNESTWAKVASITKDSSIHGLMVERHTELSVESTMEIVGVDDYGTMKFTAAALAAALMAVIMMAATKAYDWSDAYESLSWSEKLCISGPMSLMVYAVSATLSSMTCESLGEVEDSGVYPSTFGDHTVVLGLFITACLAISLALTCFCDAERVAFFFFHRRRFQCALHCHLDCAA
mmetsp:Transcript_9680/g.21608  ORF Transcript_9680/g.21608 Transcript_9680/m.21608 type:complete len:254 (+) Transcript_9680:50-811(+)